MKSGSKKLVAVLIVFASVIAIVVIVNQFRESGTPVPATRVDVGVVGLGDISTLDPHLAGTALPIMIDWHLYDRLVEIDPDGQIKPMIANSWQSNESLREWTFRIRTDVRFHASSDGNDERLLGTEDVSASIKRALRKPGPARTLLMDLVVGADRFIAGETDTLEGLVVSEDSVIFLLTRSFAYLPERLAASFFSIVPADTPADVDEPPPGSGPYRLSLWDRVTQRVVMERNEAYWGNINPDCPEVLSFKVMESEAAAVEEIRAGGLTWLEATSSILPLLGEQPFAGSLHVKSIPTTTIRLVALNMENQSFRDHPELGVALNLATDRLALTTALRSGKPVGGLIPEDVLSDTPLWFHFDPDRAKEILAELPPEVRSMELLVQPGHEPRMIAELLRQQWIDVGFEVTLQQGMADFFPRVIEGRFQMALGYYGPFVPSVDQYMWLCRSDAQPVPNVMRFANSEFDEAVNAFTAAPPEAGTAAFDRAL